MDFLINLFFIPLNTTLFILKYFFAIVLWYGVYKFIVELLRGYVIPFFDRFR